MAALFLHFTHKCSQGRVSNQILHLSNQIFEQSDITFTVISPCLPLVFTAENYQYMAKINTKINIHHPPCFWRVCSKIKSHENQWRTFCCCYQHSLKSRIQQGEGKQFRLERKKVQVHTEPCWETWDDTSRVKLTGIRCHSKFSFYDATISFLVETEQSNSYDLKKKSTQLKLN